MMNWKQHGRNNLKVQSQHLAAETEENRKNFGHDTCLMGRDPTPEPPKYEGEKKG
jgi:hypothetical protein